MWTFRPSPLVCRHQTVSSRVYSWCRVKPEHVCCVLFMQSRERTANPTSSQPRAAPHSWSCSLTTLLTSHVQSSVRDTDRETGQSTRSMPCSIVAGV